MKNYRCPDFYADFYCDDNYWKLRHIFEYKDVAIIPNHIDPLLGWCSKASPPLYKHFNDENINGRIPVLLYGNSFAAGTVDEPYKFESLLNSDKEFSRKYYFLNFGVHGYGVDQIYLLFSRSIDNYKNSVVFISLFTEDMERCLLAIREWQKPYFVIRGNDLELQGLPICKDIKTYIKKNPVKIPSYIFRLKTQKFYNKYNTKNRKKSEAVTRALLMKMVDELRKRNLQFYFIVFYPSYDIYNDFDWHESVVYSVLNEKNVTFLNLKNLIKKDIEEKNYNIKKYYLEDEHPSPYQNELVAKWIKDKVLSKKCMY